MAYDQGLAERIRDVLPNAQEKKMFGSVGWMERGNLVVGIWKDDLIARVGPDDTAKALKEKGVKVFDITGKAMKGWVLVDAEQVAEEPELKAWIERCRKFVKTLPPK